ncbi:MAG: argininosuccinate lyase [Anaerolineales bacterium]|nr:argininosuccinate lyase [Anaerolineales bacterium]
MRLWSRGELDALEATADRLNSSIGFDRRLFNEDVDGSIAWINALEQAEILSEEDVNQMRQGLEEIREDLFSVRVTFEPGDEDIHTAVERLLTEKIGELAKKIHTGRSRNDQVATDFRLWVMRACDEVLQLLHDYLSAIIEAAKIGLDAPMPGYTHLQVAQPVTWGHWMLSHFWPAVRDRERFQRTRRVASDLPLGSGALAGTSYAIDRELLAQDLGFESVSENSIDAVSDRDFVLEFLFAASVLGVHLSRLAEGLIIFNTAEFGFIRIDDRFVTGSSLMPQKKNPDVLELARGKSGRLIGGLTGMLVTLKGLPSAYDKDLQEDKEPVFDAFDTLAAVLPAITGLLSTITINPEQMEAKITGESLATKLADYLVGKGIAFRDAYREVAGILDRLGQQDRKLKEISMQDMKALHPAFEDDIMDTLDPRNAIAEYTSLGGTSQESLNIQLQNAFKALEASA